MSIQGNPSMTSRVANATERPTVAITRLLMNTSKSIAPSVASGCPRRSTSHASNKNAERPRRLVADTRSKIGRAHV